MRDLNRVFIHHSATRADQNINTDIIRQWHVRDNGWRDIGYHFVIERDGVVEEGRPISEIGAHVRGENHDSIGICMVGGIDHLGNPEFNFTHLQLQSLRELIDHLIEQYGPMEVLGHGDVDRGKKHCPPFNVRCWWAADECADYFGV